jgi:DNA-binding NtrC family response regulator
MSRKHQPSTCASEGNLPVLALVSNDDKVAETIRSAAGSKWSVINPAMAQIPALAREPNVKLVIFDDQSVDDSDRGWALTEIKRCASKAPIIYVAGDHDHESEKQARSRGVLFYTGKPLIASHVDLLLQRLLQMQNGKCDLAK